MHQVETANNSVLAEPLGFGYTVRFDDDVIQPSQYRAEMYALETATDKDKMTIRVNSGGGSAYTGIAMVNKILTCAAPTHGILEAEAQSCGSLIWLACLTHEWGIATKVMIHSGGTVTGGTPTNAIKSAESYKQQTKELFETIYKGFITEEELVRIIDDDYQLDINADELQERLQSMYSYRKSEEDDYYQEQDNAIWEANNLMVEESIATLDISQEDKDTFNRVKDLLDKSMQEEVTGHEEDITTVKKDLVRYVWCTGVTVDATDYPTQSLYLSCDESHNELLLDIDLMLEQREVVIHFLEKVTGKKVSPKKGTKTLSLELIALVTKFVLEVQK